MVMAVLNKSPNRINATNPCLNVRKQSVSVGLYAGKTSKGKISTISIIMKTRKQEYS